MVTFTTGGDTYFGEETKYESHDEDGINRCAGNNVIR